MVLLDTCASIWLFEQEPTSQGSLLAIRTAAAASQVMVSSVSAWEVGLLARRSQAALSFQPSPQAWFDDLLALPGVLLVPLVSSSSACGFQLAGQLPPGSRRLPADRYGARARVLLVTRDRRILDYARQGHVDAVAC